MFLTNKYTTWYFAIIDKAISLKRKKKTDQYYEKHHIVPKSMHGEDKSSNFVLLTAKEHFICHLLLVKMTSDVDRIKMINALIKMAYNKSIGQDRYTSNSYALVRKFIAKKNSVLFKGKKKSLATRERISKGRKGIVFTPEHLQNLRIANKIAAQKRIGVSNMKASAKLKLRNDQKCQVWNENTDHSLWIWKYELDHYLNRGYRKGSKAIFSVAGRKWFKNELTQQQGMFYIGQNPIDWSPGRLKWKTKNACSKESPAQRAS